MTEQKEALVHAWPIVEAIAGWEREHGTVAAIMPHEYAEFCRRVAKAAVEGSARAALQPPVAVPGELVAAMAYVVNYFDVQSDMSRRQRPAKMDAALRTIRKALTSTPVDETKL